MKKEFVKFNLAEDQMMSLLVFVIQSLQRKLERQAIPLTDRKVDLSEMSPELLKHRKAGRFHFILLTTRKTPYQEYTISIIIVKRLSCEGFKK